MLVYLIIVLVVVLALLGFVISRPTDFVVRRSALIPATPGRVFSQVNDLKGFNEWSPWAGLDPDCKYTFSGSDQGVGAKFHWSGSKKVGEGSMLITDSQPDRLIKMDLQFIRPFPCNNRVEFAFEPKGNQTNVVWSMFGKHNFMSKLFGLFMSMDKMVGNDFQRGLENLRARVV